MNPWIEHVRQWSKSHGVSYMCAVSKPECKAAYQGRKAAVERSVKGKASINTKKQSKKLFGELNMERLKRAQAPVQGPAQGPAPNVRIGRTIRVPKSQIGRGVPNEQTSKTMKFLNPNLERWRMRQLEGKK